MNREAYKQAFHALYLANNRTGLMLLWEELRRLKVDPDDIWQLIPNELILKKEISSLDLIDTIKNLLSEWIHKQSHNRCWYYPDIFNKICELLDI